MRLTSVHLEKFRNYAKINVNTDSDLVVVLGDNASGKTNFLESIYFLSNLKSFRAPDNLLVKNHEDYFRIRGRYGEKALDVTVQVNPVLRRGFKLDDQKTKRGLWQAFRTVLFVPNDLNLFILGPVARRKYLDEALSQKEKGYALSLASYEHVLKQRAALLENVFQSQAKPSDLEVWNRELVPLALSISAFRRKYLDFLQKKFMDIYGRLTGFESKFSIVYKGLGEDVDENKLFAILAEHQVAEIRSGQNLIGPHRDDFILSKDEVLNIYSSSRGELRSQVLALKLLEAEFLTQKNQKPMILLDDVFSELDETRRSKLLESLTDHQIFITSTEEHHLPKMTTNTLVLTVRDNSITNQTI
jgi:DNA replication and repair protein RecF